MKRFFLLIATIIILTSCSSDNGNNLASISKKPKIPKLPTATQTNLEANLLGSTKLNTDTKNDDTDMDGLIKRINQNLEQKNITIEDIDRGWYYGSEDEKKWGTPSAWIWVNEGENSRWISPTALEKTSDIEADTLCRNTGGYYVISCAERDLAHCEHIPKNICRCLDGTIWSDAQGCILVNSDNKFIEITPEELKQGWYSGLNSQKKLNTPSTWIWNENGKDSKWQNPGSL
jgi:hypothetical protein